MGAFDVNSRVATLIGWYALATAVIATQLLAVAARRTPSLGRIVRALTARPVVRALVLLVWLWVGWHFFVRSSR